ncbi:MAG: DUF2971 domain-containing protein [Hydrogenophaga sp.]|uniref:DUF2971 domain-containing protein n=2 Tax=Hydrogenophaga sp. TaxID=1904254 RepID=UPI0027257129|nr:DUF2971 domain-containing protein [Hydrogenophaga sp.]MDO9480904.1 DUF2971 domain-containing protein [Hydrogenophaga sp.]MDP3346371.1 DUF2971 domain-containing protein [Hydrogenophaga sp.]MDP3808600.1 DUF2971 domain-containing protein [Hydrogenophaga sp.]
MKDARQGLHSLGLTHLKRQGLIFNKAMTSNLLRRYTSLPAAMRILRQNSITLLTSDTWDDINDRRLLAAYKEHYSYKSVLALCFSSASETYHHWKVFAPGADGICVVFNKDQLIESLPKDGFRHGPVRYYKIDELEHDRPGIEKIPFSKRVAYSDEKEYRILSMESESHLRYKDVPIPRGAINRILVNPWLPEPLFDEVKCAIKSIPGYASLKILQSRVTDGPAWRRLADELNEL